MDRIFNTGTLQSALAIIASVSAGLTWALTQLGCTASAAGNLECLAANAPAWLPASMFPWLVGAATVSGGLAFIVRMIKGTAMTASAPISASGAKGTVTQTQVDTGPRK